MKEKNTIIDLMHVSKLDRDRQWLRTALQAAIELELSTLPPYLTALWSIKNGLDPVARSIHEITMEEMLHMALACNLLTAIGGTPEINTAEAVPVYPGPLPGGVNPDLTVSLQGLTQDVVKTFMEIESPEFGPVARAAADTFETIGEFYTAVQDAFDTVQPELSGDRQLAGRLGLAKIETPAQVRQAIDLIKIQGEGSRRSPEESPGDLAHYYRFGEICHGKRLKYDSQSGGWRYMGDDLPFPEAWPIAVVPEDGYKQDQVSTEVWDLIVEFDKAYTSMVNQLQSAWENGSQSSLREAIYTMTDLPFTASSLIGISIPNGNGTYGPCFRLL